MYASTKHAVKSQVGDRPTDTHLLRRARVHHVNGEVGVSAVRCKPDKNPMAARCTFDVIRSDYDIGGVEAGAYRVGPVPVIEGIGRFVVAAAGGCPVGIPVVVTGVDARIATSEDDKEGLLLQGGFLEGYDVHDCVVEEALGGCL